ncbi:hypothetical protein BN946_scf185043.g178 [Trametes cinnabarina]|uniref:Uncharacterized protein n=1 Tax=Pycnoporus cinnabarinus TaxID=5643 RepID=A0A060SNU5_PYCCI|nr:hypothetical protein BN946_scf185043.g178 [Trametes cinnabarina]
MIPKATKFGVVFWALNLMLHPQTPRIRRSRPEVGSKSPNFGHLGSPENGQFGSAAAYQLLRTRPTRPLTLNATRRDHEFLQHQCAETPSSTSSALAPVETDDTARSSIGTPLSAPVQPHNAAIQGLGASVTQGPVPPNQQSVASLLSQLQASSAFAAVAGQSRNFASQQPVYAPSPAGIPEFPGPGAAPPSAITSTTAPTATTVASAPRALPPRQDLRNCTFQQALPHIARLSEDEGFLKALAAVRFMICCRDVKSELFRLTCNASDED